jgi:hypothetical protein
MQYEMDNHVQIPDASGDHITTGEVENAISKVVIKILSNLLFGCLA